MSVVLTRRDATVLLCGVRHGAKVDKQLILSRLSVDFANVTTSSRIIRSYENSLPLLCTLVASFSNVLLRMFSYSNLMFISIFV